MIVADKEMMMTLIDRLHELRRLACTCGKLVICEDFHELGCPYVDQARDLWAKSF